MALPSALESSRTASADSIRYLFKAMHLNQFKINNMHADAAAYFLVISRSENYFNGTNLFSTWGSNGVVVLPLEVLSLSGGGVGVSEC